MAGFSLFYNNHNQNKFYCYYELMAFNNLIIYIIMSIVYVNLEVKLANKCE